jgi:hypothetical protein
MKHKEYQKCHVQLSEFFGDNFTITEFMDYNNTSWCCRFRANSSVRGSLEYCHLYKTVPNPRKPGKTIEKPYMGFRLQIDGRQVVGKDVADMFRAILQDTANELKHQLKIVEKALAKK